MCTTLYFDSCVCYSMLNSKSLVSIHQHTDPLYPFCLPSYPSSSLVTTTLFSVSMCSFLFGLVCSFFTDFLPISVSVSHSSQKNGVSWNLWLSQLPEKVKLRHIQDSNFSDVDHTDAQFHKQELNSFWKYLY